MEMLTDKKRTNKQAELHQFERNLAMMVIYLPVKFEFDWTKRFFFELESGNRNVDGQTNGKKRTNKQMELHQFLKEPSYDGDLSPCQV